MASTREYDIILLGATGYTGKLTAEYITSSVTEPIKWAIAGRTQSKLNDLASKLKASGGPGGAPATIVITELTVPEVTKLAKTTKILLNTVGPYHKYCTPVVQACAETGTHYLDVTGETPWVKEIITKFEDTAKKNRAVIIPEIGIESAPSDLVAFSAVKLIREIWDCGVMDMVASVHELKSSGASGGTLATGLGLFDHYGTQQLKEISNPFCLSPLAQRDHRHTKFPAPTTYRKTLGERISGVWQYPLLGHLTTSITAGPNQAIVHRSSGRYPYYYGFNFNYAEYMAVDSPVVGMLISWLLTLLTIALAIPPIRAIVKGFMKYKPGEGPSVESTKDNRVEIRAVAVAEQLSKTPRKAFVNFVFEGGVYELTARLLVIGAITLLKDQDKVVKTHGFGFLTPSSLGQEYIDRLDKAGVKLKARQLGDFGSK
ncbi:hypothetical protein H2198_000005 [Neophaeococcomyces mojaviensis]|uniref:Uncharacterized protein n=1 Tax=Neophaeococcomyces mojaviensis TaxID=3383035 RepID=A0ACC3AKQ3_9EURO|nr:hypothetical protein H2198_000005 [Knufia sp. JES_112]